MKSHHKKLRTIGGGAGRKAVLSKKLTMDIGTQATSLGSQAGDDALFGRNARCFADTVMFARYLRDIANVYDRYEHEESRAIIRRAHHPVKWIIRFLVDTINSGSESVFAEALGKVYRSGVDKQDAFPELEHIPLAYADALNEFKRLPFVPEVQAEMRNHGFAIDESTLRKHLKALGLKLNKRGANPKRQL